MGDAREDRHALASHFFIGLLVGELPGAQALSRHYPIGRTM
jgi:hypothetical protein